MRRTRHSTQGSDGLRSHNHGSSRGAGRCHECAESNVSPHHRGHSITNQFFSVYVKNLEERIKIDQMKEALSEIFSEYGNVVDLVAKTNLKAKGQAFVVFDDTESAERAIKEVQGFELFEKPMLLDFAKTRSDATVAREGTTEELELHKRRRLAEKGTGFSNGNMKAPTADIGCL